LASWMKKGEPSTAEVRPWLMIVVDDGVEKRLLATFSDLMRAQTSVDVTRHFGGIRLVSLARMRKRRRRAYGSHWSKLKCELLKLSKLVRKTRAETSCLFTARHLAGFLQQATGCITAAVQQPFDFIRTSRLDNPVAADLSVHLARFFSHIESLDRLKDFAVPMVASTFMLDHYPPGMHRRSNLPGPVKQADISRFQTPRCICHAL
jgi:hypothetical protein